MQKFNILIFFFIMAVTSGCHLLPTDTAPVSKDAEACTANFIVDEVTGTLSFSDEKVLPEKFTLQLNVCLRSKQHKERKLHSTDWVISNHREHLADQEKATIKRSTNLNSQDSKNGKNTDDKKNTEHTNNEINKAIQITTDGNGCLHWTETYDYAYSKQSQWIEISRFIQGITNEYPGTCKVPMVVNPWLQLPEYTNIQVADNREKYHAYNHILKDRVVKNADGENMDGLLFLKAKKEEEGKNKVDLLIEELKLVTSGSQSEGEQSILPGNTIEAKLQYTIQDIHGSLHNNQISQGDFTLEPYLLIQIKECKTATEEIAQCDTDDIITKYIKMNNNNFNTPDSVVKTQFLDNILTSEGFDWKLPAQNLNDKIALYLKVIPQNNTARRVSRFEGIYHIGDSLTALTAGNQIQMQLNNILANKHKERVSNLSIKPVVPTDTPNQYNDPNDCLADLPDNKSIAKCLSMSETADIEKDGFGQAGWAVEKMSLRFFNLISEDWLNRNITTLAETIIQNPLQNRVISNRKIDIAVTDLSTGETERFKKETDSTGHISFNISTSQKWYKRQRYFLKIIHFTTQTRELNIKKMVAINPWDYGFTHGFEVDHPDGIRTTCLENGDRKKISKLITEDKQDFTGDQIHAIHNLFCHNNPSLQEPLQAEGNLTISQDQKTKWANIFNIFKTAVRKILISTNIDDFYKKFMSVKEVKRPTFQVHLFRAINKFPTYLIDDSLNREIYYNIRFKISPSVVRHDSISIGQQDKGPIRDGVYLFQMAVLKNEQGRFDGAGSMVLRQPEELNYYITETGKSGTVPLFHCPLDNSDCVTKEDFVIPPQNIPVIIRDGIMKTDIRTHIRREHLLFANSKNILVFRLLPADPASIVCKEAGTDCTIIQSRSTDPTESWETAFDWEKTAQNIQPAKPNQHHDMFFYTYKTPFIPSLWTNWNITHELNIPFDALSNHYAGLIDAENNRAQEQFLSDQKQISDRAYTHSPDTGRWTIDQYHSALNTAIDNIRRQKEQSEQSADQWTEEDKTQLQAELNKLIQKVNEDSDLSPEEKQTLLAKWQKAKANPLSLLGADEDSVPLPGAETAGSSAIPKVFKPCSAGSAGGPPYPNTECEPLQPTMTEEEEDFPASACVTAQTGTQQLYSGKDDSTFCGANNEEEKADLTDMHTGEYAAVNSLCVLSADGEALSNRQCGNKDAPIKIQSFLDNLNKEINIINNQIREVRDIEEEQNSHYGATSTETMSEQEKMAKAFVKNHYNSEIFKNKLRDMPLLPGLNTDDLKNIISAGVDRQSITNTKTGAFVHALCGFWFKRFLSSEYMSPELLADGIRQAVKRTLYYKMRGVSLPEDDNDTVETSEGAIDMKELREGLQQLKTAYTKYLEDMQAKGNIDDLHKWADDPKGYGFDSAFAKNLLQRLREVSQEETLNNSPPSWEAGTQPEGAGTNNPFPSEAFLNEAVQTVKNQRVFSSLFVLKKDKDYHPFRKCINNPSHFFGFEQKIIVGRLGDKSMYGTEEGKSGGETTVLNISEDFLINAQRDQGSNQQFEGSVKMDLNLLALPLLLLGTALALGGWFPIGLMGLASAPLVSKLGLPMALLGFIGLSSGGGSQYSYRSYEGTGKRKTLSTRVSEGVELISEHTPLTLFLKKHQKCLVIRPRWSAFESYHNKYEHIWSTQNKALRAIYGKSGILLCNGGGERFITEDYYYIYPNYGINGITMDPSSHRNKPFAISLRGKKEYQKFLSNLNCHISQDTASLKNNMDCRDTRGNFEYLLSKKLEFARNLRQGFYTPKMFHLTGDTPGVYSRYQKEADRDITADSTLIQRAIRSLGDSEWMDIDLEKIVRKEIKE